MSRIHFKILGKIVYMYSTRFFPKKTELYLLDFFHDIVMEELRILSSVLVYI